MSTTVAQYQLGQADVVIRPMSGGIVGTDFQSKHLAILEGEKAAAEKMDQIPRRARQDRPSRCGSADTGRSDGTALKFFLMCHKAACVAGSPPRPDRS